MDKILEGLIIELDDLKTYINFQSDSYKTQSKIEKSKQFSVFDLISVSKIKQFDFNSHIISAYGAYEHFIEQLLTKYLQLLSSKISNFDKLPKEIQTNNLSKCLEILKQIDFQKNKNIKKELIIEILHKNFNENCSSLNIEAFKNHSANFRIGTISSYFSEIGINNCTSLIKKYPPLKDYLDKTISDYSQKKDTIVFQIIEEICNIRNNIAHGVRNIQLLNKSILFDYIDFIKIFCSSLCALIKDKYYEHIYDNLNEIEPINIYNNSILCFNTNSQNLDSKTKIIAFSRDTFPNYVELSVIEIQHDNVKIESTQHSKIDVGVLVNKKIRNTMRFRLNNID